jgi:hypothetical protein
LRRAEADGLPCKNGGRTIYRRVVTGVIERLLYTGCRLSEVRWEHIDFAAGVIKLADTSPAARSAQHERAGAAGSKSARSGKARLGMGPAVGVKPKAADFESGR